MIYLFTAMYSEARSLIAYFQLKKDTAHPRFQVFWNKEKDICLTITGVGAIAAAAAVGSICTEFGVKAEDFLVNIGACAGRRDGVFLCNKLTEEATGKRFYPDIVYHHNFLEGEIVTGVSPKEEGEWFLYDMESAAIYQAGAYFFGPHQMCFLKIVSDRGNKQAVTPEQIERLFAVETENIAAYLQMLRKIGAAQKPEAFSFEMKLHTASEKLSKDMHCSYTMKASLLQHLRYLALSGADYASAIDTWYQEKKLPCKDKREGKRRFEEWKKVCGNSIMPSAYPRPSKRVKEPYYTSFISHIYVEKSVWAHPVANRILDKFPNAKVIEIDQYKDVFCRRGQNYLLQHQAQNLILAAKTGNFVYQGAPVCQNFGNEYFYYTSCMMNCIFDCEYCYLKGMYPSGNLVIFVNLEDYFAHIQTILERHSMYLCASYDTDLLAFEHITGYAREWVKFAEKHPNLKLEIRTKCADKTLFASVPKVSGVIYAFTLSPQPVIDAYEHGTPSLENRIDCAAEAVRNGHLVRLCFDPVIYCPDWKMQYDHMLELVFAKIRGKEILDVSVGTFRISQDYLKHMRKQSPYSAVVQYPYVNDSGVYQYPKELAEEMEGYLVARLQEIIPKENIFLWEKQQL